MNTVYYGDNLDMLRRYIKDESVDLIYLDPPFKRDRDYNILFEEKNGTGAASQIKAFEDTWQWDQTAAVAYHEVVAAGGNVSEVVQAFRKVLGHSDMLAYLAMMAPQLVELRRVLKATGSLYLHCDTTASHYLKLLLVYGFSNGFTMSRLFQNVLGFLDPYKRLWRVVGQPDAYPQKLDRYIRWIAVV
jgi:site-specific DNA-methyltransferase (adenine-specific)